MTTYFGRVSEFDPDKEEWPQYVKRLDNFFAANQVQDAEKTYMQGPRGSTQETLQPRAVRGSAISEVLVTDNGPSFISEEFEQFLKKNAIRH